MLCHVIIWSWGEVQERLHSGGQFLAEIWNTRSTLTLTIPEKLILAEQPIACLHTVMLRLTHPVFVPFFRDHLVCCAISKRHVCGFICCFRWECIIYKVSLIFEALFMWKETLVLKFQTYRRNKTSTKIPIYFSPRFTNLRTSIYSLPRMSS